MQHGLNYRQDQIVAEAGQTPKDAFSEAMNLPLTSPLSPNYCPRAVTLRQVARIAAAKDRSVARSALEEIRRIVRDIPLRDRARLLSDIPELYLLMGDKEASLAVLADLLSIARMLYAVDSDPSDPNLAFKGMWPSTDLWRYCIRFAAEVNPYRAEAIIEELQDPDIKAFGRIALASSLLGTSLPPVSIMEKHKSSQHTLIRR